MFIIRAFQAKFNYWKKQVQENCLRMNKRRLFSLLLMNLVLIYSKLIGQELNRENHYSLSALYAKGYIYAHTPSLNYLIKGYTSSVELNLSKTTDGSKLWQQLYRFPNVGLAYSNTDFGNPQQLGHANTIYTYIMFPAIRRNRLTLSYKCAVGAAWHSEKYDLQKNRYNIVIGSKLNAYLNLNLNVSLRLSPQLWFLSGIGMSHFSNGGTQQPNKGINIFSLQSGLQCNFPKKGEIHSIDSIPKFKRKNEFSMIYCGGEKTLKPAQTKKYYVSVLSLNAERQISYKNRFGIGIDVFKDNSRKEYLLHENIVDPHGKDVFYAGAHASYDLVFGNTSFTIQMGGYFWQKSRSFENVYHRFGLKYRFSKHLMANITLKTYWANADFAEWGIGYRF
jgi:hypothetical protein